MSEKHRTRNASHSMNRRTFLKTSGGAAITIAGGSLNRSTSASAQSTKPNMLLVITDQQHIDTIAAGGCPHLETPAMDWLKNRGVSFSLSYTADPLCSPARSAIFTGRTPSETGVYQNGLPIRRDIPNIGQWFSQHTDYETVYAGKWHLPRARTHFIPGFNVIHTGIGGQGNLGDTGTSRACDAFLRNRTSDKPFLMVASFMQPHDICEWLRLNTRNPDRLRYQELAADLPPLPDNFAVDPREPAFLKSTRQQRDPALGNWDKQQWRYYLWSYYRHIEMVDAEIGRVLQALRETGHEKNTLIVFTSDHGEGLAHHQMVRKSSSYDEASKVPLLVSLPGRIPANRTDTTHLVTGMDIMPTLCGYAGIAPPNNMRGMSLRPLFEEESAPWRRCTFTEIPANIGRLIRTPRYKYVTYKDDPVDQLFDMQNDPGETTNLATSSQHASVLDEHKTLLREWERQLDVAPRVPNPDAWRSL